MLIHGQHGHIATALLNEKGRLFVLSLQRWAGSQKAQSSSSVASALPIT